MNNLFLGMTLGADPHTVGIYRAGRIAKMLGIDSQTLSPAAADKEKIEAIAKLCPKYLGLSYRLSAEKAAHELEAFLAVLERTVPSVFTTTRICFAALPDSLNLVHNKGLDSKYHLFLEGQAVDIRETTKSTIRFFQGENHPEAKKIIETFYSEVCPPKIKLLDEIARDVIAGDAYLDEPPLSRPSEKALGDFTVRMQESGFPVVRSHFGIPSDSIDPTVEGIMRIAAAGAVDEISLGSSDLSQRYFGDPGAFVGVKNDGGTPYKTMDDLRRLFMATRVGNFPSIKPYCHVSNILGFVDQCLEVGMLRGAHQAVPLFWFSELDGRGPMSVDEAISEHIKAVRYLVSKGIPTEMNDPNQWSSRLAHDAVFVADYGLIASVMYAAGSPNMIFQCQFNKPVETGDYADLAKFYAVRDLIETLRPNNNHRILIETRSGIEHFSVDQQYAKFQLARSTLLQMIISPSIVHLVSYCEADHAATADDVIESSKILRRAMRMFKENEIDIRRAAENEFINERKKSLLRDAAQILYKVASCSPQCSDRADGLPVSALVPFLSDPEALKTAMKKRIMTAPGIMNPFYNNTQIITHSGAFGTINCYRSWEDNIPMSEEERLAVNKYDSLIEV